MVLSQSPICDSSPESDPVAEKAKEQVGVRQKRARSSLALSPFTPSPTACTSTGVPAQSSALITEDEAVSNHSKSRACRSLLESESLASKIQPRTSRVLRSCMVGGTDSSDEDCMDGGHALQYSDDEKTNGSTSRQQIECSECSEDGLSSDDELPSDEELSSDQEDDQEDQVEESDAQSDVDPKNDNDPFQNVLKLLQGFKCGCPVAQVGHMPSCLCQFTIPELGHARSSNRDLSQQHRPSVAHTECHQLLWNMYAENKNHQKWRLEGKPVCKKGWMAAMGFKEWTVREALSKTLQGISPQDAAKERKNKRMTRELTAAEKKPKKDWAESWWAAWLRLHEHLPNEHTIQVRGPPWNVIFKEVFLPEVKLAAPHLVPSYTTWMKAQEGGLERLAREYYRGADGPTPTLRCKRSARHSHFPECNTCQQLRTEYLTLASNPFHHPEELQEKIDAMKKHNEEWSNDRKAALDLKYACAKAEADARFQCDDKCGSQWCEAPVEKAIAGVGGGRVKKADAKKNTFPFAIHANVFPGVGGLNRFTVVNKSLTTGANYGCTNFVMALKRAFDKGSFPPHVHTLYRHTDGGSDNQSITTQVLHWLLVYLGVFQTIVWFRFEAGHSHTEMADRLFSILKRLFIIDGRVRPKGFGCFVELWQQLQEKLQTTPEANVLEWDLANWDFDSWFNDMNIKGNLSRVSNEMVYRYEFVEDLWSHGCVRVTYKSRLSYKAPHALECEYSPVCTVERKQLMPDGSERTVHANQTDKSGVIFIVKPPDLTTEPKREALSEKVLLKDQAQTCKNIAKHRTIPNDSKAFWCALAETFDGKAHPEQLPSLPCVIRGACNGASVAYSMAGTPCALKPILRSLAFRFERKNITHNPFEDPPPEEFNPPPSATRTIVADVVPTEELAIRDPRATNTVIHEGHSKSSADRDAREMAAKGWIEATPERLEEKDVVVGELYLLEIETDTYKHELKLGLARVLSAEQLVSSQGAMQYKVHWLQRATQSFLWPGTPTFKPGYDEPQPFTIESFRLRVAKSDLTQGSQQGDKPRLRLEFMERVHLFAKKYKLRNDAGGADEEENATEDDEEDSVADNEEDEVEDKGGPLVRTNDSSDESCIDEEANVEETCEDRQVVPANDSSEDSSVEEEANVEETRENGQGIENGIRKHPYDDSSDDDADKDKDKDKEAVETNKKKGQVKGKGNSVGSRNGQDTGTSEGSGKGKGKGVAKGSGKGKGSGKIKGKGAGKGSEDKDDASACVEWEVQQCSNECDFGCTKDCSRKWDPCTILEAVGEAFLIHIEGEAEPHPNPIPKRFFRKKGQEQQDGAVRKRRRI